MSFVVCICIQELKKCNAAVEALRKTRQQPMGALDMSPLAVKMPTCIKARGTDGGSTDKILEGGAQKLVEILELTEKELFESNMQLKAKVD